MEEKCFPLNSNSAVVCGDLLQPRQQFGGVYEALIDGESFAPRVEHHDRWKDPHRVDAIFAKTYSSEVGLIAAARIERDLHKLIGRFDDPRLVPDLPIHPSARRTPIGPYFDEYWACALFCPVPGRGRFRYPVHVGLATGKRHYCLREETNYGKSLGHGSPRITIVMPKDLLRCGPRMRKASLPRESSSVIIDRPCARRGVPDVSYYRPRVFRRCIGRNPPSGTGRNS